MSINLLPWRERRNQRKNQRFIGQLMAIIVILIGLLFSLYQYLYHENMKEKNKINHLTYLLKQQPNKNNVQQIETLYQNLSEQIKKAQAIKRDQAAFWDMLAVLKNTASNDIRLNQLSWKNQQLVIIGEADRAEVVAHFMDQLESTHFFKAASIDTLAQIGPESVAQFSIHAHPLLPQ